jgi:hypothetical protein
MGLMSQNWSGKHIKRSAIIASSQILIAAIIGTATSVPMLLMIREPLIARPMQAGAPRKINIVLNWTEELIARMPKG